MTEDEGEPVSIPAAREPPPRALTRLSPLVRRLVAPNPSPFTFNGTCTYIVGRGAVAVVDPGPDDESHLQAILDAIEGETVETILVTHTHRDHSPGAARLHAATGARIVGAAPFTPHGDGTDGLDSSHDRDYAPDAMLADGERFAGAGFTHRGDRDARPLRQPSVLRASRRERALLRRSRDGLVDVGGRAAGRFDGRLHGLARQAARARTSASTGRATAARSSNRSATCGRSSIIAASARRRSWRRSTTARRPFPLSSRGSMPGSTRSSPAPPACRRWRISKTSSSAGWLRGGARRWRAYRRL